MPAAAVIGIGMAVGGVATAIGASSAAHAQEKAAQQATRAQMGMYNQTRSDLQPFQQAGQGALNDLTARLPQLTSPFNPTMDQLEQTPGYQFTLAQGLKKTQSAAAARGLGVSGAALKGAATYATGLADSTYQQQFANAQTRYGDVLNLNTTQQANLQNQYNRLIGTATLGESAAAQTGAQGTQSAAAGGAFLNQAGQASAAGTMGAANALTGGINSYLGYNALKQYTGGTGGYGQPTGAEAGTWD